MKVVRGLNFPLHTSGHYYWKREGLSCIRHEISCLLVDPVDVARRDYMEFFIEKILDHRGNLKFKTDIEISCKMAWI